MASHVHIRETIRISAVSRLEIETKTEGDIMVINDQFVNIRHPIVFGNTISEERAMAYVNILENGCDLEHISHLDAAETAVNNCENDSTKLSLVIRQVYGMDSSYEDTNVSSNGSAMESGSPATDENSSRDSTMNDDVESDNGIQRKKPSLAANTDSKAHSSQVAPMDSQGLERLWQWNRIVPQTIDRSIHELVMEQVVVDPNKVAVISWDGELTYSQVDQLSTHLAGSLIALGAESTIVPLCFEKSMWTVVGVLAVMKAGAGFLLMDPSQPEVRLRTIVDQVKPKVLLSSKAQHGLGSRLAVGATVVVVARDTIENCVEITLPRVPGSAICYLQFTSGSTGIPKGVVISHSSYTSGAILRAHIVGYTSASRVLDFASYAFDVSIDCMLCTLSQGGCICVPSDEARVNDLGGAIKGMNVNMAHMTPSVARVLDESVLSCLTVLGLGGETVTVGDAAAWTPLTRIIIAYGPSECTVGCTVNGTVVANKYNPSIGKGVGGLTWIVNPSDHEQLMPIGDVGELLIEGPIVGQGYLNNDDKTSEVFIEDPTWLVAGCKTVPGRHGRLYKTGDLVKYDADGSIVFGGRKDTQVKLRGQRVELSEVEHHLRLHLPSGTEVAAEVIIPKGDTLRPTLVAFVTSPEEGHVRDQDLGEGPRISALPSTLLESLPTLEKSLNESLPIYMIPSGYIPIHKMPMMVSGKLDRNQLRDLGSNMSSHQLSVLRGPSVRASRPETSMELRMKLLWSKVLGLEVETISIADNYFNLGGDSISVMRLVSVARTEGLLLTVQEVFQHAELSDMAQTVESCEVEFETDVQPFSLLKENWSTDNARSQAAQLCGLEAEAVEDMYPCTPLQEGLMALSSKRSEAYVAHRVVELPDQSLESKLRAAWNLTVAGCSILRTRIVYIQGRGLIQVVVKENISWASGANLETYIETDRQSPMQLGMQLARYAIILDETTGKRHFVWTLHHALYDGWSMSLIMERVKNAYLGQTIKRPAEFNMFIKYLSDSHRQALSRAFWSEQLKGANGVQFPTLSAVGYEPRPNALLEHRVAFTRRSASSTTVSTIIRAAWALIAAQVTGSDDVVFGETLIGRNVPVAGVDQLEGPTITTVPVRVRVNRNASVNDFIRTLNDESVLRIPHEHMGLQHIRRLSPDALIACDLRTGLVIQPSSAIDTSGEAVGVDLSSVDDQDAAREALQFNSYALMLVCSLEPEGFLIMASFDNNLVDILTMERLLSQFDDTVQHLSREGDELLGSIQYLTPMERQKIPRGIMSVRGVVSAPIADRRPPETEIELKLQSLWSSTIGIDKKEISANGNFFGLGGDSITAMKLVAAGRLENIILTVAEIFRHPLLVDMAHTIENLKPITTKTVISYIPFSALKFTDAHDFVECSIRPLLVDSSWKVQDVIPTTSVQELAVNATVSFPRFSVQYNLMYLDPMIDSGRLLTKLGELIKHHEILRTVFIKIPGQCLGVVLEELKIQLEEYKTSKSLEAFVEGLCARDACSDIPLGSAFLKSMLVRGTGNNTQNCLILRISHAQYDGISLPNLFLDLKSLYNGTSIQPAIPFSSYIYSTSSENICISRKYWHDLLHGSSISQVCLTSSFGTFSKATPVSKNMTIALRPKEITTATLLTAGWSLVLARHLSTTDVTFGRVVSGRNIDLPSVDRIMGSCDNHNPVRVVFQPGWTGMDLLRFVQDQHVSSMPFQGTQFRDIVAHCTDWPAKETKWWDSVVHHSDIDFDDQIMFGGGECRLEALNPHEQPAEWWRIQSRAKGEELELEVVGSEGVVGLALTLLEMLGDTIPEIIREPDIPLAVET